MTSALHDLSTRLGILPEYIDQSGKERRFASDETRVALLAAMGIDASTEAKARRALDEMGQRDAERLIPPVRVLEQGCDIGLDALRRRTGGGELSAELRLESGELADAGGQLPLGYHTLRVRLEGEGAAREAEQSLIVVPPSCVLPRRKSFGVTVNLYSVRSTRNWGVGDLTDLGEILGWCGEVGGQFVGVSPLHALRNRGLDISPYSPVSRLFRNPLYLDVEAVPEFAESSEARAMLEWETVRPELARLRESERVEYARVMALKRSVLEPLHRTFATRHRDSETQRGRVYARYVEEQGGALSNFAVFCALEDHFTRDGEHPPPWQEWPAPFRDPASPEVAAFREAHREEVDFHRWLQFELDRQLGAAARRGREAGLSIGLYQDLAIGTAPNGGDTWAFPHLFAEGVSIGAPPDDLGPLGQNWGLPPLDPHRLVEDCYRYWITLVRASLQHAGALRIDHVLGLFRQYWIPHGKPGTDGAYVRFPTHDLLGILALESVRHGAVIVGEDLGTVPPEVPSVLKKWGLLSSRVLLFERDHTGRFRQASQYEPQSLATANTHDMPTLAGFWQGRDIELKRQIGVLASDGQAADAIAERERERRALLHLLVAEGLLPDAGPPPDGAELRGALHRFLCRTPALLVGLSLEDLVGEVEPVNLPGVSADLFPSWTRRLRLPLEQLRESPEVATALSCERKP